MTAILLVGAGAVGRRAARQLAETEGVERLLVTDSAPDRAETVADYLGGIAKALEWNPADPLPAGVAGVAAAVDGASERAIAERALESGVPLACASDDSQSVHGLLDLDDAAREAGVAIAAACAFAPGLSDVLARHAAGALERVDEIHVARAGAAGPACIQSVVRSTRSSVQEWRDGAWVRERAWSGRQLVWFPAPVGGLDCHRAASAQPALLVDAFPQLSRATMRVAAAGGEGFKIPGLRLPKVPLPSRRRGDPEGEWGAVWVEVRGRRGRSEEILVYGAVDRMAFASGAVLAQSAAWLAGLGGGPPAQTGVHGLAALVDPVPFLSELARRGLKAAAFEGSPGA